MTNTDLHTWLDRDDRDLIEAIKSDVRDHVTRLRSGGDQFYGYAILPGECASVGHLVAAFNRESDLDPEHATEAYYRYSVDEWANYEHNEFKNSDQLIQSRNAQFTNLHVKADPDNLAMDGFERAHIAKLHNAILTALAELRTDGVFGDDNSFVVIWIPDSGHEIIYRSARELNAEGICESFMEEFGE